ncbi:MAG: squalene--hopene cyclase, partial [Bacillota bacterium]|nr:squalene--hopene cyclase [Bacillota bacterium]
MDILKNKIAGGMNRIIEILRQYQSPNGSWEYPFETGISTDVYMIILIKTLELNEENLVKLLVERILSKQEENGSWKLFYDEEDGNLNSTVEAYYALLYSGHFDKKDKRALAARTFILSKGGLGNSQLFTRILLNITGQLPWQTFFPIPIEVILLPQS